MYAHSLDKKTVQCIEIALELQGFYNGLLFLSLDALLYCCQISSTKMIPSAPCLVTS